jgi:hypothetical protein
MTSLRTLLVLLPLFISVTHAQDTFEFGGGPVIRSPKVIVIYWGDPDPAYRQAMDRFYSQLTRSSYMARLSDYNAPPITQTYSNLPTAFKQWYAQNTPQTMGSARYAGSYVIRPSWKKSSGKTMVGTTDIGPELDYQVSVGKLPRPDRNTIYALHFSTDWAVYMGTNLFGWKVGNWVGEGFCGYHAAYYSFHTNQPFVYTVNSLLDGISGCQMGSNTFDSETYLASHELMESITDPGSDVIYGGFLSVGISKGERAWYDHAKTISSGFKPHEVADQCRGVQARIRTSPDPRDDYAVAATWQFHSNSCVVSAPIGKLDEVKLLSDGQYYVYGWALDPNGAYSSIDVHAYFDGPYPYGSGVADKALYYRPDVNSGTGYPGPHGFWIRVPEKFRDGLMHTVHVYGIGLNSGNNTLISGSGKEFVLPPLQPEVPTWATYKSLMNAGLCMDVQWGYRDPGTPLHVWGCDGNYAQQFKYVRATGEIKVMYDENLCLDAALPGNDLDPIQIWPCHGGPNQKWTFTDRGEFVGFNGKCIDVFNAEQNPGTRLIQYSCLGAANQRWLKQ